MSCEGLRDLSCVLAVDAIHRLDRLRAPRACPSATPTSEPADPLPARHGIRVAGESDERIPIG
jgi:hypothetical protein